MPRCKNALLIHSDIYGFGGAEIHCVRIAEILQKRGIHVTVLHASGTLDVEAIRSWSGMNIDPNGIKFETASPFKLFPDAFKGLSLLRYAFVVRYARRIAKRFDISIATYGECPIHGTQIIQSIYVPLLFHDRESLKHLGIEEHGYLKYILRVLYVIMARRIAGWRPELVEA